MHKLIPLVLALIANVLGLPDDLRDPTAWIGSTAALGAVVWATVTFLRAQVIKNLDGPAVLLVSLVVGGVYGVLLGAGSDGLGDTVVEWLAFGLGGGLAAIGIDQGAKKLGGGQGNPSRPAA